MTEKTNIRLDELEYWSAIYERARLNVHGIDFLQFMQNPKRYLEWADCEGWLDDL